MGSPRISSAGLARNARASARRCRSPPETAAPWVPTRVFQPWGSDLIQVSSRARAAAAASSSSAAPGRASVRLSRRVARSRPGRAARPRPGSLWRPGHAAAAVGRRPSWQRCGVRPGRARLPWTAAAGRPPWGPRCRGHRGARERRRRAPGRRSPRRPRPCPGGRTASGPRSVPRR